MASGRAAHSSVKLSNGAVLIAGGFTTGQGYLDTVDLFDPRSNTFSAADRMNTPRASHTATTLADGRVLIAGGYNGNYLDSTEFYDPKTKKFVPGPKLNVARRGHKAVTLIDGHVLLVGGTGVGWTFLADAEIFDPVSNTFTETGRMTAERESHTATLLKDGRVMIAGGHRGRQQAITIYSSIEIFDPTNGKFETAGDMTINRHKHDAVLLNDGRVLIIGGANELDGGGIYSSVEVMDPSTNNATKIGDLIEPRYKLTGTSILLNNGKVFIAGGAGRSELFDPESGKFQIVGGIYGDRLSFATATHLADGRVLIAGGYNDRIEAISSEWIFAHRDMPRSSPDRTSR
jgi:N-acetylneuraminic acid mutarotase